MTTETKIAAQLDDGHYEIEVRIYEKRLNSAPQQAAAPGEESEEAGIEPLLEELIRAAYDDGDNEREEFSERVKAARASVVAYVQRLAAAPQQQDGERDWLAEAMDSLAEWRFDALFGGKEGT